MKATPLPVSQAVQAVVAVERADRDAAPKGEAGRGGKGQLKSIPVLQMVPTHALSLKARERELCINIHSKNRWKWTTRRNFELCPYAR